MSDRSKRVVFESSWAEIALDIAQLAHLGQVRRSDKSPYITHPVRVYSITKQFGYSKLVQIAAILHDAIEDAQNPEYIESIITKKLPAILPVVKSLTYDRSQPYKDYVIGLTGPSLQVKLSDMLHNVLDKPVERQRTKYRNALLALASDRNGKPSEIREDHWAILLNQVGLTPEEVAKNLHEAPELLKQYIRLTIEGRMIPEVRERFDLRKSASAFIAPIFQVLEEILEYNEGVAHKNLEIKAFYNGGEIEIDYVNGKKRGSITSEMLNDETLERLEGYGMFDLDLTIKTGNQIIINADYQYDASGYQEEDVGQDLGGVVAIAEIPSKFLENEKSRRLVRRKLRGTFAHEIQHIIQRIIFGTQPSREAGESIEIHMADPDEIDARVEEIIAACEEEMDFCNIGGFRQELEEYVDDYLNRNGIQKNHPSFKKWKSEMIKSHLIKYREKFEMWG
ncbi:MAG: HD domain-containing protein [Candidatus Thorarchaeota archaeon]|jgi:hypothetical protein